MRALILLAMLPVALSAQALPPPLQVEGVGEPVRVNVAMHRGYPAYPAWTLRALGARVNATARGARVIFGADSLIFEIGSPYFTRGAHVWQLVHPAYQEGGIVYLPHQLFAEWLPATYPDQVRYAAGTLRLAVSAAGGAAPGSIPGTTPPGSTGSRVPAKEQQAPPRPLGTPAARPIVIVDPGHGGVDPGAVGPSGLKEKDVVLQIGKRLAKELAQRGYDVRMTRTTDTLIDLEDRPHMANEWRGSRPGLFLSIHANNFPRDNRVKGFETFFLSDARTEDEQRVAEMENAAVSYQSATRVAGSNELELLRNGFRNEFFIRSSYTLAGLVQNAFEDFQRGTNRGVKQAGFIVLIGAFMPAVLVETAFISNPQEERLLGSGSFQVQLAEGIADAVDRFFETHQQLWAEPGG